MAECTSQIRFFKVTELPLTGVPNAIYLVLDGGFVRQYVTDSSGVIFSAPSVVETLTQLRRSGNSLFYTDEASSETIINFAPVAFSGAYTDLVGSPTNTSSFTNDGDGTSPYATLDDIPTDLGDLTFNFNIASSIRFSPGDQTVLELVDRNGVVISSTSVTTANIAGLANYTGFDTRYYTEGEINDFLAGNTPITGYNKVQWDEAYSWGDHSLAGYLTSFTESDPIFSASPAASITNTQISNWNIAYSWGDHRVAGYLTEFIETDPLFRASAAFGIDSVMITNWNTAYGWGNHALAGYLSVESDPVFSASPAAGIDSADIVNWNLAFGWGDHNVQNYARLNVPNTGTLEVSGTVTAADVIVNDEVYSSSWDGSLEVPTKNAVYDRVEQIVAGGADKTFTFVQGVPAATWNINHNMNKFPSVTVVDSANTVVIGNIEYIDSNNLTLTFSGAFSGRAELN